MSFTLYPAYRTGIVIVCIVIAVGSTLLGTLTALTAGPIWDDATEIAMMRALIVVGTQPALTYEAAKAVMDRTSVGGSYYGAVFQYIAHGLQSMAHGDSWLKISYTVDDIVWRHVLAFALTLGAVVVLIFTVVKISGSRAFGAITSAVLLSTPVFLGLSAIDGKDAPISAGMTLLSCGASLILWKLFRREAAESWRQPYAQRSVTNAVAISAIFSGTLIAFGTRAGAAALIGVECAVIGAVFALALPRGAARMLSAAGALALPVCAGIGVAILINPIARKAPVQWILEGVVYATRPATQPLVLYNRTFSSDALPWWYIPGWLSVEYSAAFWVLFVVGLYGLAMALRRAQDFETVYPWVPFAVQGFVIPVCIILSHVVLHDRLRHLLFMIPPFCMVAAAGLYFCVDRVKLDAGWPGRALVVLGPVLLLLNSSGTFIWYPYQYAYLNELGRSFPQFTFDAEPLGLSIHESVKRMRQLGVERFRAGPAPTFVSYDAKKWGIAVDLVSVAYKDHPRPVAGGGWYYVQSRPSWTAAGLPDFCRTRFQIERQGVILGVGGEC